MWIRSQDKKLLMNVNAVFVKKNPYDGRFHIMGGIGDNIDEYNSLGSFQYESDAIFELGTLADIPAHGAYTIYTPGEYRKERHGKR